MRIRIVYFSLISLVLLACGPIFNKADLLPDLPEGVQAVSLLGDTLFTPTPVGAALEKYNQAKADYEQHPEDADALIWFGRRTAYLGQYREAIAIYSEGIEKHPQDARMYRHRGHRLISIREFGKAVQDFKRAADLIEDTEDEVEPDGMPNRLNIPVSTLHTNIWYHLGLAYYLQDDMLNALRAYRMCLRTGKNDDNLASACHWLYMILRRLGSEWDEGAASVLDLIDADLNIIENMTYHRLLLFYKGKLDLVSLEKQAFSDIMNDAAAYGIGNWHLYNGDADAARAIFERIMEHGNWASFGYIAAETDLSRM